MPGLGAQFNLAGAAGGFLQMVRPFFQLHLTNVSCQLERHDGENVPPTSVAESVPLLSAFMVSFYSSLFVQRPDGSSMTHPRDARSCPTWP